MKKSLYRIVNISSKVFFIFTNISCSMLGVRTVEEASYEVKLKEENKEIRQYPPQIVAKTTVTGAYKEAQRKAFRILADYIFGNNTKDKKIAMTAPVTQKVENTKIAMTAPVMQKKSLEGWVMSFSMPSKYKTIPQLPEPIDSRVNLTVEPGGLFAAIRYSWWAGEQKNQDMAKRLLKWVDSKGIYEVVDDFYYAGYNPPWTVPFLRRNEILVRIKMIKKETSK